MSFPVIFFILLIVVAIGWGVNRIRSNNYKKSEEGIAELEKYNKIASEMGYNVSHRDIRIKFYKEHGVFPDSRIESDN